MLYWYIWSVQELLHKYRVVPLLARCRFTVRSNHKSQGSRGVTTVGLVYNALVCLLERNFTSQNKVEMRQNLCWFVLSLCNFKSCLCNELWKTRNFSCLWRTHNFLLFLDMIGKSVVYWGPLNPEHRKKKKKKKGWNEIVGKHVQGRIQNFDRGAQWIFTRRAWAQNVLKIWGFPLKVAWKLWFWEKSWG